MWVWHFRQRVLRKDNHMEDPILSFYVVRFTIKEDVRVKWEEDGVIYDSDGGMCDGLLLVRFDVDGFQEEQYKYFEYSDYIVDELEAYRTRRDLEAIRTDKNCQNDRGEFYISDKPFCIKKDGVWKRYEPTADKTMYRIYNLTDDGGEVFTEIGSLMKYEYYKAIDAV